jgi:hypothetical protein
MRLTDFHCQYLIRRDVHDTSSSSSSEPSPAPLPFAPVPAPTHRRVSRVQALRKPAEFVEYDSKVRIFYRCGASQHGDDVFCAVQGETIWYFVAAQTEAEAYGERCAPNQTQTTHLSPKYNPSLSEISGEAYGNKTRIGNRPISERKSQDSDEW